MNDMTTGSPFRQLFLFMIPVFLGNLCQNLYNIVDLIIVGQFLGANQVAAIGATSSLVFFITGWIIGLTTGFGILIAQTFGAHNTLRMRACVANSAYLCTAFSVVMTVALLFGCGAILQMMNTPREVMDDTYAYIFIIFAGTPITFLYNMLASIARALGDSKTPLYFLIFSSFVNIALDVILIGGFHFGVSGAAYATVFSQTVAAIACLFYVGKKYPSIRFTKAEGAWDLMIGGQLLRIGVPMGLQFSITAIGTMIVQSTLNLLGAGYIAAYTGSYKMQSCLAQFPIAIGSAIASFTGQNYGANRIDRVQQGVRAAVIMVAISSAVSMVAAYFICPNLITVFAPDETGQMIAIATEYFHTTLWFYFPLGLIFIYRNALQGLGNSFVPLLGGVGELLARALAVALLFEPLQFQGIVFAEPMAWMSAILALMPYYYWYMKHRVHATSAPIEC